MNCVNDLTAAVGGHNSAPDVRAVAVLRRETLKPTPEVLNPKIKGPCLGGGALTRRVVF